MSVFNVNNTQYKDGKYPLFCGESVALIDLINSPYPELYKLYQKQASFNWAADEVDLSQDRMDMLSVNKEVVDLMVDTLLFQWSVDSTAANSILPLFAPFISSPELHILMAEVTRFECLSGDHDVLTDKGWKPIPEVTKEDKVAQWDYDTKEISFVNPTATIKKKHSGKMYQITSASGLVDQFVTPNHRIPLVYPYSGHKGDPVKLAEDVVLHGSNAIPVSGFVKSGKGMSDLERLYVAVQADGSLASPRYTGARTGFKFYTFRLKKERKIERLLGMCDRLGFEVKENNTGSCGGVVKEGFRSFRVYVPLGLYEERAKTFDWFDLDDVTLEWAEDFIEELGVWDGCPSHSGMVRYISSNKNCIEKASIVGRLAGYRTNIYTVPPREDILFPDGNLSDTKEAYQLGFNKAQHVVGNTLTKEEVDFEGDVYCLSVPTSFFMVRRNGAVSITGNCIHSESYSLIIQQTMQHPKEALHKAMTLQESIARGENIVAVFDNLSLVGGKVRAKQLKMDSLEAKEAVFLGMVNLYILERISFMSSFAVTFAISELGVFQGIGKLVSLIARDEQLHAEADKIVCKHLMKQMPDAYETIFPKIKQLIDEAVAIELGWNEYLFKGRSCVGLTQPLLDDWVKWMSKDLYETFGIEHGIDIKENPLPYMESYLDLNSVQVAAQESTIVNYLVGGVKNTLNDEVLEF